MVNPSSLPDLVRAFVALRLPDEIIEALAAMQQKLKRDLPDISWTRPDAMHLTLRFLGNVASADLPEIETALARVAAETQPFGLRVFGAGSFGNRVVWAGLMGDVAALGNLASKVRDAVSRFASHEEQRDFKGHVTLGRARRPGGGMNARLSAFAEIEFGAWRVDHVELIRSELLPRGSRYTTLAAPMLGSP